MHSKYQPVNKMLDNSISPKLTFDCIVNDKKTKAFYYGHTDEDPMQHTLEVGFSDGHHSVFGCDEEYGWFDYYDEKDKNYVAAIKDDLTAILMLEGSKTMWSSCFLVEDEKSFFNIYIRKIVKEDKGVVFTIYYNGDYRFDLKKTDADWEWSTSRKFNPETKDDDMVCRVIYHLEEQGKIHRIF